MDALISFKLCRTLYHCKIQVQFNIGNHLPILAELWPFFDFVFVVCVCLISFEGMH